MVADNDFGYFTGGTPIYSTYFEATYGTDSGSKGVINGQDIMAGISTDISSDPYPDNFTINGAHAVGIFANASPNTGLAGERIQRNAYKAIYFAWDFNYTGGTSISATVKTDVLQRAMNWLKPTELLWLSANVTNGTVAPSGAQAVNVTFDAGAADVMQPGTYKDSIVAVSNNPVNGGATYPVTMTVTPPATWGKLTGVINGLAACDVNPAPLANADVLVHGLAVNDGDGSPPVRCREIPPIFQPILDRPLPEAFGLRMLRHALRWPVRKSNRRNGPEFTSFP